jgi:serine/threonine protein kinase
VAFKVPKDTTTAFDFNKECEVWEEVKERQCLYIARFQGVAICGWELVPAIMTERGTDNLAGFVQEALKASDYGLSAAEVQRISFEMLVGLSELHILNCAHRDIKPGNVIMVGKTNTAKLIDLGAYKNLGEVKTGNAITLLCTRDYAPPELMRVDSMYSVRHTYGSKIDSWSWAATVVFMLTKRVPWVPLVPDNSSAGDRLQALQGKDIRKVLMDYPKLGGGTIGTWLGEEGLEVLVGALQWDLKDRLTAAQLLKAPWYKEHRMQLARRVAAEHIMAPPGDKVLSYTAPCSQLVREWKEEGLV